MKLIIKLKKNETTLVDEIVTADQIPADVLDMVKKIRYCTLTIYRQD